MERTLYDTICDINKKTRARFCMPGHSGMGTTERIFTCAKYDWTEVYGLDNLLQSQDVIMKSENAIAKSMGYASALMLTQGSTCGMHIAVNVCKDNGKTLVAIGDMHKSFYAACRLYGAEAVIAASVEDLRQIDFSEKKVGGVFVTSPDYFGKCRELSFLRELADKLGAYFVVDEAHASHFAYSSLLPNNAHSFADISLMSMHKTMPVYGLGALVCLKDESLRLECERYRAMIHSSSPNYLVMASMDYANSYMSENGEYDYARAKKYVDDFSRNLAIGQVVKTDDFSRLVIKIDGKDACDASIELAKRGVFVEMAKDDLLVCIVTPFNCVRLNTLAQELKNIKYKDLCDSRNEISKTVKVTDNSQDEIECVDIENCAGRICAEDVGVYPPGVPVAIKGEVISKDMALYLKKYRNRLFGLAQGRIAVIK